MSLVQVAIQDLNKTIYQKNKIFISPDPAFDIAGFSPFLLEAKIRSIRTGINENVGTVVLEYPGRPFGSHTGMVIPIQLYVDNSNNMIFRGFLVEETGVLDKTVDQVNALCYDYKWFIHKLTKVRGKVYTVDNAVIPDSKFGGFSRVFADEDLYEKFKMRLPTDIRDDGVKPGTGFLGTAKTIFNENSEPNCATDYPDARSCFKLDPDFNYIRNNQNYKVEDAKYFFNYATMIKYVVKYYINNLLYGLFGTTGVDVNDLGLANIIRFGEKYGPDLIRPSNFDITGKSPLDAIDTIVKHIPGSWYWRLLHYPNNIRIDIQNHSEPEFKLTKKSLFMGDGNKLNDKTNNDVNVESVRVTLSSKDAISQAIAVGGPIEIETSVQYLPAWPRYLRPNSDRDIATLDKTSSTEDEWNGSVIPDGQYVCDFKGYQDFDRWKRYTSSDERTGNVASSKFLDELSGEDRHRYSLIGRIFVFPENSSMMTRFDDVELSNFFSDYQGYATYLDQLFLKNVIRIKTVKSPMTRYRDYFKLSKFYDNYKISNVKQELRTKNEEDPPFVFLYDSLIKLAHKVEKGKLSSSEAERILNLKRWIIPSMDKKCNFSFENDYKVVLFNDNQLCRKTLSYTHTDNEIEPRFHDEVSRKIFVTCRIECDVPRIMVLTKNKEVYSNARLVHHEIDPDIKTVIRMNAIYPNPSNSSYTGGSDIDYDDTGETEDAVGDIVNSGQGLNEKLVDWNVLLTGNTNANLIVDDTRLLQKLLNLIIDGRPLYSTSLDATLGRLDLSYQVGDIIDRIVGSELSDGSGGYYNLDVVIESLEYNAKGTGDAFNVKISARNDLPFVTYYETIKEHKSRGKGATNRTQKIK